MYQLAAVLLDGPTVVVSPLLALQEDQTTRLETYGRQTVARRVSSAETRRERGAGAHRRGGGTGRVPLPGARAAGQRRGAGGGDGHAPDAGGGRRGPLRVVVGPRLPARLPAARRTAGRSRPRADHRAHGDRGAARPRPTSSSSCACTTRRWCWATWRGRTSRSRCTGSIEESDQQRRGDRGGNGHRGIRASSTSGTRKAAEGYAERTVRSGACWRRRITPVCGCRSARRSRNDFMAGRLEVMVATSRSGWASTRPTCATSSTPGCRNRPTTTTSRSVGPAGTASRRWACCSSGPRISAWLGSSPSACRRPRR